MGPRTRTIWKLSSGSRLTYAWALLALIVASALLYLAPLVPQITIDGAIAAGDGGERSALVTWGIERMGGSEYVARNLWWPAVIVIVITVFAGVFTFVRSRLAALASERMTRRLRDALYDQLQHLPCVYFDHAQTGDLIQRCTSDVDTLRQFLATQTVEIGRAIILLLLPIPIMLMIDVRMTLVAVFFVPPIVVFCLLYFSRVKFIFKQVDEAEGRMTSTIQENLTGIRVVRAFARQAFEREKFHERNDEHRRCDRRLYDLLARFWSISDLLCFLQKALVVGAGAYWLALGELRVGAYYYFLTVVGMFIWPVRMMGRILADLGKAVVALGRVTEILEQPRETRGVTAVEVPALAGEIEFEHAGFAHVDAPVLDDVSFRVSPGETIALLGPSGCGKTTIVNLLLRLYDCDTGVVRLDGHDIKQLDRTFVRRQMAVVLQEPFLFSKTLRDNVTLGRPQAVEDEMIEATTVACVHESILGFEDGYDTRIGERGVTLSGGQRQRVALARALLQDPAVLILDDALSAVDTETETKILAALAARRGRHTTVLIAHRLSTTQHADRILVLESGRLVQSGSHEELLAVEGRYRRLWELQQPDARDAEVIRHG